MDTGLVVGLQTLFEYEEAVIRGVSVLLAKFTLLRNPVFKRVSLIFETLAVGVLMTDSPFNSITCDMKVNASCITYNREVGITRVMTRKSLVWQQGGWVTGSLDV